MSAWRGVDPSVMAAPEASIATKGRRSPVRFRAFRPENRSCACAAPPGARAPIRSRAERAAGVCRWVHPPAKNTTHLDTGQINEFESAAAETTGLSVFADAILPDLAANAYRSRILDAFRVAELRAQSLGASRQFVFVHVMAPHPPQVFDAAGQPLDVQGFMIPFVDEPEILRFGFTEYARRLKGELQFLNERTIHLVDAVMEADPGAVVVVFSDHGSGAPSRAPGATYPYADLRTANLLAVRSPGHAGIIDDRSTLANLLPRLLRAYTGSGPTDVPETIFAWTGDPSTSFYFERPD